RCWGGPVDDDARHLARLNLLREPLERRRHRWQYGLRPFRFDELEQTAFSRNDEVYFEALFVAKVVKLPRPPRVNLVLRDFRRDEALEDSTDKRRALELRL